MTFEESSANHQANVYQLAWSADLVQWVILKAGTSNGARALAVRLAARDFFRPFSSRGFDRLGGDICTIVNAEQICTYPAFVVEARKSTIVMEKGIGRRRVVETSKRLENVGNTLIHGVKT